MKITVIQNNSTVSESFDKPTLLSKLLGNCGLSFCMPCGGKKLCKKCLVSVSGDLLPPDAQEKELLKDKAKNLRYACMAKAVGDVTVTLDTKAPVILPVDSTIESQANGITVCIDLGTTTVAASLYGKNGNFINSLCCNNSQRIFGSDVITRLNKALTDPLPLQKAVINDIDRLCGALCRNGEIIENAVICGNTAMMYLLCGKNPKELLTPPFKACELFGSYIPHNILKSETLKNAAIYLSPCVSAYIGGDITAGMLCADMQNANSPQLLVDIGTNCEFVLYYNGKYYAASTPAGPVFEGYNISCGTAAVSSAVCKVEYSAGAFKYETVGNASPIGFCGTGIIEFICALRKCGIIDTSGSIVPFGHGLHHFIIESENGCSVKLPGTSLFITSEDIRNVQYAKSAIKSGIEALLDYVNLPPCQLEKVYIAGGFGNYLNISKAASIGIIPKELQSKAVFVKNAAANGAVLLTNDDNKQTGCALSKRIETVPLTENKYFAEQFIENMNF